MKVEVRDKEKPEVENKYPYIGIFERTGSLVLFTSLDSGVFLREAIYPTTLPATGMKIGEYSTTWAEDLYSHYYGEVVLSND